MIERRRERGVCTLVIHAGLRGLLLEETEEFFQLADCLADGGDQDHGILGFGVGSVVDHHPGLSGDVADGFTQRLGILLRGDASAVLLRLFLTCLRFRRAYASWTRNPATSSSFANVL